jgi:beta-lactamase superfamily II metal-dependent hydrolase
MKVINRIAVLLALTLFITSCSGGIKNEGTTRPHTIDSTDPDPDTPDGSPDKLVVGKVGEQLAPWVKGSLDIHFINTGRGESTFYVLPDGTTLLVDAAGSLLTTEEAEGKLPTAPKPDANTTSGKVIINYINHFTSSNSKGHIDYAMVSHFHEDHIGTWRATLPLAGDGTFRMTSFVEVGTTLPYKHYIDRCYPKYDYPTAMTADKYTNLRNFVAWSIAKNGTVAEAMDAGALDQIKLVYDKASYPSFKIQNLAANGRNWTGKAQESIQSIPATFSSTDAIPDENCFSCAFRLSFGSFDYYTGGDNQYTGRSTYSYNDSEAPIAAVVGNVDVAKGNHHGTKNANSSTLMKALQPTVWISHIWRDVQPNTATITDVLSGNPYCDIFLTNLADVNVPNFSSDQKSHFLSTSGHVVVRVNKTGTAYYVYVLDDNDMKYTVKSVHGPYQCK